MSLMIPGRSVRLEAVLRGPGHEPVRGAAVLCHPHPVHGGTMENRVIFRASKAAVRAGFAALRFNFRGVGASTGSFDKGEGEKDDVTAAIDWMGSKYPELPMVLIGFSFGAWVGLQVGCRDLRVQALVGLGLPLTHYDFDFLIDNPKPTLLIMGTRDEFCPREKMERLERRLPPASRLHWIDGAEHFFARELDDVQDLITGFFNELK